MDNLRYISNERIRDYQRQQQREQYNKVQDVDKDDTRQSNRKSRGKKKKKLNLLMKSGMDTPFFILVIVLLVIGIAMMFSASYAFAYYTMGDSYFYLIRQVSFAVIGVVVMVLISFFDYHNFHKLAVVILAVAFVLLVVVLFMPPINNVHRWLGLGLFSLQASEVMKMAIIIFYAHWASIYFDKMNTFAYGVLPALIIGGATILLLYFEPHFSGMVIIVLLLAIMMWISGVKARWFGIGIGAAVVGFLILYVTGLLKYAMERLDGWGLALEEDLSRDMQDTVWQTMNSLYAIGSGGLTGLGLGQSREKYLYLPEPQNDFVFAVVIEELGLVGGIIILAIFAALVIRGILISLRAKDRFGMLLGVGFVSQVGLQVILNILVITDTLPNTGISLPFFSYGGSSLVMLLAQMGIVLSVSRNANINKT